MKLTTKLLTKLIKEVIAEEFKRPSYGSDEYRAMQRDLNDKYGVTFQKIDGRMQRVQPPALQELIKDLEKNYLFSNVSTSTRGSRQIFKMNINTKEEIQK